MALLNVPFLIRTLLRMAGFRIGGGGGGGGRGRAGFGFFLQRSRQNLDASDKFLKGDDTVSTHLRVVRHHLRNY